MGRLIEEKRVGVEKERERERKRERETKSVLENARLKNTTTTSFFRAVGDRK